MARGRGTPTTLCECCGSATQEIVVDAGIPASAAPGADQQTATPRSFAANGYYSVAIVCLMESDQPVTVTVTGGGNPVTLSPGDRITFGNGLSPLSRQIDIANTGTWIASWLEVVP